MKSCMKYETSGETSSITLMFPRSFYKDLNAYIVYGKWFILKIY